MAGKSRTLAEKARFLGGEEHVRGKLPNGKLTMPEPHFVQPRNGAHLGQEGGMLSVTSDLRNVRVKSGNVETDIHGGLY